jgi:hypothetical protein
MTATAARPRDTHECELQRRTLVIGCEIERALEQPAGLAVAPFLLEQAGRVDLVVRARVVIDRARGVADALGDLRRHRVAPHLREHVEARLGTVLGRAEGRQQLGDLSISLA